MVETVTISKRQFKRLQRAEEACKAFREAIEAPVGGYETPALWSTAMNHLFAWMRLAGDKSFLSPKKLTKNQILSKSQI